MNDFVKKHRMNKVIEKCLKLQKAVAPGAQASKPAGAAGAGSSGSPASGAGSAPKPQNGTSSNRNLPVGTVHNGRKKISDNPSKWVDVHTGDSFDDHKTAEKHDSRTADTKQAVTSFMDKVKDKIHPADVKGVEEKLHQYLEAKVKVSNLMQAANKDSKSETGEFSVMTKKVHQRHDQLVALKNQFVQAVKASIQRKKEHGL